MSYQVEVLYKCDVCGREERGLSTLEGRYALGVDVSICPKEIPAGWRRGWCLKCDVCEKLGLDRVGGGH